jgi:hypothetical protein
MSAWIPALHAGMTESRIVLTQLSQPEGQGTGKVNKNNVRSQKVSTTFALPSLVYHMTLVGDSGWRLRRQAEVQLF